MDKLNINFDIFGCIASAAGFITGLMFGQIGEIFYILTALVVLDFCTGIIKAIIQKELNSTICFEGIIKKVFIFIMVSVGHLIDSALGLTVIMNTILFFYIANESISIIENAASCGIPFPKKITDILIQLRKTNDEETNSDEN